MKRILVYRYIDIFNKTDYKTVWRTFQKNYSGCCPNFGNKLWYQGLISEISSEDNFIDFYDKEMSIDMINSSFDFMLAPMANVFSVDFIFGIESFIEFINKLRIPVFVISCGASANSYDDLDELINSIGNISKKFIKAVYDTGGDLALRGYFTGEFFKRLGFLNPSIVGCPSLFQIGRGLKITNSKVEKEEFKVALNGDLKLAYHFLKKYDGLFYDQDIMFRYLYDPTLFSKDDNCLKNALKIDRAFPDLGTFFADLLSDDRIRLIADMWDWQYSLINEGCVFSFGTRIHGNIMSLLSQIPCVIINVDTRVKEMAEFYNIPNIDISHISNKKIDLFELYTKTDYTSFNSTYNQKYDEFEKYLIKCGIVDKINSNNKFLFCSDGNYPKTAQHETMVYSKIVKKYKAFFEIINMFLKAKNKHK